MSGSKPAADNGGGRPPVFNTLRVGGVPEHFNHLWVLAQERGLFEKHGVRVAWTVQRCGTGEMIASVHRGDLDVVVALTEGVIADAAKHPTGPAPGGKEGDGLRILGTYVQSPLCWAVSCGPQRPDAAELSASLDGLRGKSWAISRYGSGSHLMAYVLAQAQGWDTHGEDKLKFVVAGNINGLIQAVSKGGELQGAAASPAGGTSEASTAAPAAAAATAAAAADLFMWETFTTKPYHDRGVLQRVGEFYTPWPCFVVASTYHTASHRTRDIQAMFGALSEAATAFVSEATTMPDTIAEAYGLQPKDAAAWYKQVKIQPTPTIEETVLRLVYKSIRGVGVLGPDAAPVESVNLEGFIAPEVCSLGAPPAKQSAQ